MPWEMRCFHLGLKLRGGYYPPLRAPGGGITPFTPPLNTRLYIHVLYTYRYRYRNNTLFLWVLQQGIFMNIMPINAESFIYER